MSIEWTPSGDYTDIRYEVSGGDTPGIARLTIDRPQVHNAFRPETIVELSVEGCECRYMTFPWLMKFTIVLAIFRNVSRADEKRERSKY